MRLPARGIRNPAPGRHWRKCQADKCRCGTPEGERVDRKMRECLRTVFRRIDRKIRQRVSRKHPAPPGAPFPHWGEGKRTGHPGPTQEYGERSYVFLSLPFGGKDGRARDAELHAHANVRARII
jgi:hypothetical protein